jgi:PAS domain S-box-containing protein
VVKSHADDACSPARLKTVSCILDSLLESSSSPIFSVDAAYRYTSFNTSHAQAMKALYGADIEVGKSILEFQTVEDDRRAAQAYLDRALQGERVVADGFSGEESLVRRYFKVTHGPIRSDGVVIGAAVQAVDVTELKHAEQERQRSQGAISEARRMLEEAESLSKLGGWRYDVASGRVTWTDEVYRIYGVGHDYDPNDAGDDIAFYAPQSAPLVAAAFRRAVETGEPYDLEVELDRADGARIWVRTIGRATVEDGAVVRVTGNIIDISERKRAEEDLRESEDKFKYVFDHSVIGKSITLPTGEIHVNDAFCLMLGYSREELENSTWRDITHPDDVAETDRQMASLRTGTADSARFLKRFLTKGGSVLWADISSSLRRDEHGEPLYFMTTAVDVTEQRRTEHDLRSTSERLSLACLAGGVGIWEHDIAGGALIWDAQMLRLYGIMPDHFSGTYEDWRAAVHPGDLAQREADLEAALSGGRALDSEFRVQWPDGTSHTIRSLAHVHHDASGRPTRLVGVDYDITSLKRTENEIRRLNDELEQRVLQRTAQLDAANEELEAFAYSVSHDLRAPLRALDGFSQILLEDYGARLDDEGRSHLARIRAADQRMGTLIDALLELSRLNRGKLSRERLDISALARSVAADLADAEPERAVELVIADGLEAHADRRLAEALFANLLGNAWKFTAKHETARIGVGATDGGGELAFYVRDDGAGFDMEYADKLFGAFQRLHGQHEFEGLGIGLATVQRIVHRHGGRVWAEGGVEKGATFWFTLPEATDADKDAP